MKLSIIGTGYVGLVTGTCFADVGNQVLCVDKDQSKIDRLLAGDIPIYEPGLNRLVAANTSQGRLNFTTSISESVDHSQIIFIAVGTPPDEDGSADLSHVLAVARSIGQSISEYRVVVTKSTVPVGTSEKVRLAIQAELDKRGESIEFSVASNPEFLKEGAAIDDFMKPDRIVVGADDERAVALMRTLYSPFNRNHERLLVMDIPSAELTKYAANAMLATKISFMNELSNLAERLDADIELVRQGIGSDPRIGYHFSYPGCGYGGSCFPKDVQALHRTAGQHGYSARILDAVEAGDNVGVLLRGVERTDIERGQVLCKPGSVTPHTKFEAQAYVLKKEEGGRHTPFFTKYRPQFYFRTTDVTGEVELPSGTEMVMPGDDAKFVVKLITPIAMSEKLNFAIREGGRTVGAGVVTKIIE